MKIWPHRRGFTLKQATAYLDLATRVRRSGKRGSPPLNIIVVPAYILLIHPYALTHSDPGLAWMGWLTLSFSPLAQLARQLSKLLVHYFALIQYLFAVQPSGSV